MTYATDIAKNVLSVRDWDNKMTEARQKLDWKATFEFSIYPEKAIRYRKESTLENPDTCTMCGKMCA